MSSSFLLFGAQNRFVIIHLNIVYHCDHLLQNLNPVVLLFHSLFQKVDLLLFKPGGVLNLPNFDLIGLDVVNQLVDVVERHPLLHLLHDLRKGHLHSLDIYLALLLVLQMLDFIPFALSFLVVLKDILHSLRSVCLNNGLDFFESGVSGLVGELKVINEKTLACLEI